MTMHEARMTTHAHVSRTRRFGAIALLGGLTLSLAVTVTAAPMQAGDAPSKPAAAAKVDAAELYQAKCQVCHMADGNSQIMPNMSFADGVWKHGATLKAVQTTISNGVPGTAMIAWKEQLSPAEIAALAKFVRKFDKKLK
jgi:mono/diheme cytochrome c family protein